MDNIHTQDNSLHAHIRSKHQEMWIGKLHCGNDVSYEESLRLFLVKSKISLCQVTPQLSHFNILTQLP